MQSSKTMKCRVQTGEGQGLEGGRMIRICLMGKGLCFAVMEMFETRQISQHCGSH